MRQRILGRILAEPVHPAYPVGHQVRPVRRARSRRIRAMSTMTRASSDLNQRRGSPRQRGGHSPRATTTATSHPPHPAAPGIQGTNPGQLRP